MPPKPKFTKEQIAKAALDIIREGGVDALTARDLGSRLGSSPRPIFTTFNNMNEVKMAAREVALREFEEYAGDFEGYHPAFKRVGMLMVSYAIHEPEMYKLLFMQEHETRTTFENTLSDLGCIAGVCVELIMRDYELEKDEAQLLFEQLWIHTFGLGALCAMKVCDFTEEEIALKLGQIFFGLMMFIKNGKKYPVLEMGPAIIPSTKDNFDFASKIQK